MKWKKINDAVYSASSNIIKVDRDDITMLKKNVIDTHEERIRICAHQTPRDRLHEMIIMMSKNSYIRPHKHLNKSESFHIIEGELDVIIFDDSGNILEVIKMGNFASGKYFFYRVSAPYFHTLFLQTKFVIFHETTNGPFEKDETVYAPWAPAQGALEETRRFLLGLENKIGIATVGTRS